MMKDAIVEFVCAGILFLVFYLLTIFVFSIQEVPG